MHTEYMQLHSYILSCILCVQNIAEMLQPDVKLEEHAPDVHVASDGLVRLSFFTHPHFYLLTLTHPDLWTHAWLEGIAITFETTAEHDDQG